MIFIRSNGALGNMFFHIAAIWTLAKDNGDEMYIIDKKEKIKELINDKRCEMSHAENYKYLLDRFGSLITNPWKTKFLKIIDSPFTYSPLEYKNGYFYRGYYQSEKWFSHRREEIIKLFHADKSFLPKINKYSEYFGHINLHVRRGDYLTLPNYHPVQTMEYYTKALAMMPKELKVLVFSDDLLWCRENFIGDRFIFVDEIDYICVYIMAKMKYHIIANSSFSWWGAWMSEDKIVVAPKVWFGKYGPDYKDVCPEEWILI